MARGGWYGMTLILDWPSVARLPRTWAPDKAFQGLMQVLASWMAGLLAGYINGTTPPVLVAPINCCFLANKRSPNDAFNLAR